MAEAEHPCDGCTGCAMRCTDGVKISEFEYTRIVECLRAADPVHAGTVLSQAKERQWFEEITYTACLFLDQRTNLCLVYEARPLICRLYGRIAPYPCPLEKIPPDLDARRVLAAYAEQPLATFQQWMAAEMLFNFADLLGTTEIEPTYEL